MEYRKSVLIIKAEDIRTSVDWGILEEAFDVVIVDTMEMWKYICPNFVSSLGITPEEDLYLKITSKTKNVFKKIWRYIQYFDYLRSVKNQI